MELPREIIVGNGSLDLVGEICKKLGFSRSALVVTGPNTLHVAGKKVIDMVQDEGLEVNQCIVVTDTPTIKDIEAPEERIRELEPEVVLGVGGGAKIDIAKLSSARQGVPFISVPTTASHDGITSAFASLKELGRPYSARAQSPVAVIADTEIIIEAPYRFLASGCGDMIAKYTSTRDWRLAHEKRNEYYAQYTASLAIMSAQHIVDHADVIKPGSEEGLRVLLEALVSSGVAMGIAGTSKPCSGSEHLFSHALDLIAKKPAMHGEQCGLGTIMMAYLHGIDWKIIRETLRKVGAPTTVVDVGIDLDLAIEALVMAPKIRSERYTILSEKPLTRESARELVEKTGVVG